MESNVTAQFRHRSLRAVLALAFSMLAAGTTAFAQPPSDKVLRIIVAGRRGATADIVAHRGQCELAVELMCERALSRRAFGKHLSEYANVQDWIAHSRVEIDQVRLLVLQAPWKMDTYGNKAAHIDVAAIKLLAARLQTRVVDRAMQIFGAMGVTPDNPLSYLWSWGRAMRFFDGPDEVHLRTIARAQLARARENLGSTAPYYNVA